MYLREIVVMATQSPNRWLSNGKGTTVFLCLIFNSLTTMLHKSLPETDYQTRCIEAERTAAQYKKAYFALLSRYCDMVDKHIAETDREIAVFASTSLTRPIDPFILMKMGANSDVAQCK